jgi:MFS family permease
MLSALTVPMALATIPGGMLSDKYGYRLPAISGLILAVLGLGLMKTWTADISYTQMVPHLMLGGVGIGLTMAPVAAAVINSSPIDQRGTSSALVIIFRLVGMTIGVSTVTTYDLIRFERVSNQLLSATTNLNETVQIGMQAMEQVISETFVLAGIVAALAFFPVLLLKNHPRHSEEE